MTEPQKPHAIFLARAGQQYRVKTPGWQRLVPAEDIRSELARAWMRYGDNPSGCHIVGDTAGLEDYIAELQSGRASDTLKMRVAPAEKAAIEARAKEEGHRSVSAYLLALHRRNMGAQ